MQKRIIESVEVQLSSGNVFADLGLPDAMSMNELRRLAAKIDQRMQQLAAQGVSEAHAIINRMSGV